MLPSGVVGRNRSCAVRKASGPKGDGIGPGTLLVSSVPTSKTNIETEAVPTAPDGDEVALTTLVPSMMSSSFCAPRSPQNSFWRTTVIAVLSTLVGMNGARPLATFSRIRWSSRKNGSK